MSTDPWRRLFGTRSSQFGAIAQLGERLNGIQEVTGSIPVSSTRNTSGVTLVFGDLGQQPLWVGLVVGVVLA
jgi:hypothetical protein